jgi:hypothetical protein
LKSMSEAGAFKGERALCGPRRGEWVGLHFKTRCTSVTSRIAHLWWYSKL